MSWKRKPPRWTDPFLLALLQTGEVRGAAKWAGVDFTTAYARRKMHADFAFAWDGALEMHKRLMAEAEAAELESLDMPSPGSRSASPTSPADGRGGAQVKRVNSARWTEAKERRKLGRLRQRMEGDGWTLDEVNGHLVPPGFVRDPNHGVKAGGGD